MQKKNFMTSLLVVSMFILGVLPAAAQKTATGKGIAQTLPVLPPHSLPIPPNLKTSGPPAGATNNQLDGAATVTRTSAVDAKDTNVVIIVPGPYGQAPSGSD